MLWCLWVERKQQSATQKKKQEEEKKDFSVTPDQQDIISTAMSLPANVATEVVSAMRDI